MYKDYKERLKPYLKTDVNVGKAVIPVLEMYARDETPGSKPTYQDELRWIFDQVRNRTGVKFPDDVISAKSNLADAGITHQNRAWAILSYLHVADHVSRDYAEKIERSIIQTEKRGGKELERTFFEAVGAYFQPRKLSVGITRPSTELPHILTLLHRRNEQLVENRIEKILRKSSSRVSMCRCDCASEPLSWIELRRFFKGVDHFVPVVWGKEDFCIPLKQMWSAAREIGISISPIVSGKLEQNRIPNWFCDLDPINAHNPEEIEALPVRLATGTTQAPVHFANPGRNEHFVRRPKKQAEVGSKLLGSHEGAISITTSLHGAGGFGKTVLASMVCADPSVRAAFHDGIYYLEIGRDRGREEITPIVSHLVSELNGNDKLLQIGPAEMPSALANAIGDKRILIVADDIWRDEQLNPLRFNPPHELAQCANAALLFTTRVRGFELSVKNTVDVDKMEATEALELLCTGIPEPEKEEIELLQEVCEQLHHWSQLLSSGNRYLRTAIELHDQNLSGAILDLRARTRDHIAGLDPENPSDRTKAVAWSIATSLAELDPDQISKDDEQNYFRPGSTLKPHVSRFLELGVFPEDQDIPEWVISALWLQRANMSASQSRDLIKQYVDVGLLRNFSATRDTGIARCHDNFIHFSRDELSSRDKLAEVHADMAKALIALVPDHRSPAALKYDYFWDRGVFHMYKGEMKDTAKLYLTDLYWIKKKIEKFGPDRLYQDLNLGGMGEDVQALSKAIALSLPDLRKNPGSIESQLLGRLA